MSRNPFRPAETHEVDSLLRDAWRRRASLHDRPDTNVYRCFHGHGDGHPGMVIDRIGNTFVLRTKYFVKDEGWILQQMLPELGFPEARLIAHGPDPARGPELSSMTSDPVVTGLENGLAYGFEPEGPGNPGLYLDARPARAWVQEHAEGRRLLNLFAWTGGFGVAGLAGGGLSVTHVDMQKRALVRARENHARNGQRIDDRDLERENVYRFLRQAAKRRRQFGGIVIDSPPQIPTHGPITPIGQDYPRLVPMALELLAPGGWILCAFSRRDKTRGEYEEEILAACEGAVGVQWRGESGIDFPEEEAEHKLRFAAFERR